MTRQEPCNGAQSSDYQLTYYVNGVQVGVVGIPTTPAMAHSPDDGLTAAVDMNVLDLHFLLPLRAIRLQCLHLGRECPQQPVGKIGTHLYSEYGLTLASRTLQI